MESRGLTAEDMIVPVEVLSKDELTSLMEEQDVILTF